MEKVIKKLWEMRKEPGSSLMWIIRHIASGDMPIWYYKLISYFLTDPKMRRIARYHHRSDVRLLFLRRTGLEIGEDTSISQNVSIIDGIPPVGKLIVGKRVAISTGVIFICYSCPDNSELKHNMYVKQNLIRKSTIVVEDDAWIGAGAIVLPNVTIGRKSIVGAGAVVCDDVPPYSIVAGVPARVIRNIIEYEPEKVVVDVHQK